MSLDVIALGEAMIEFNQTQRGSNQYLQGFGGDTSNAVIAAARAGARCGYVSAVGDDAFGQMLLNLWQKEGVETAGCQVLEKAPTGLYFVTHDAAGHHFSYRRSNSAASRMQLSSAQSQLIKSSKWLHYSGISLAISQTARDQCQAAVKLAKAHGASISFDSNLRLNLWQLEEAKKHMIPALATCDLFLPSLDDVRLLSNLEHPESIMQWCHAQGARRVALKMGSQGVLMSDGLAIEHIPAQTVQEVDATAAGDCFAGNLLARLCLGDDWLAAGRYANAAAALSVTGYGAVAPLPFPKDVNALCP